MAGPAPPPSRRRLSDREVTEQAEELDTALRNLGG